MVKIQNTNFSSKELDLAVRKMEAYVNDFNVDSLESEDDVDEVENRLEELKIEESLTTLQKSSEESLDS